MAMCSQKEPFSHQLLPALAYLLDTSDKEVLSDACWALSYLTDGSTDRIQAVINVGTVPKLVGLLGSDELTSIVSPEFVVKGLYVQPTKVNIYLGGGGEGGGV